MHDYESSRYRSTFDAHQIAPKLYQGSAPPSGPELRARGFDMVVFAAEETQPPSWLFPGVKVIHAPSDDSSVIPERSAHAAAQEVARALIQGKRVLVTCHMGLNRSGIITALALWYATGRPGYECVERVQDHRPNALMNQWFADYVSSLPPRAGKAIPRRHPRYQSSANSVHV